MRLYPPFPMFSRSLDKSYEIAGKLVPQGKELALRRLTLRHLRGLYCNVIVVALVRSRMNGLIPFERTLEQTAETMLLAPKQLQKNYQLTRAPTHLGLNAPLGG